MQSGRVVPTGGADRFPLWAPLLFLSTPNCSLVQEEESQIPSRNFCSAVLPGTRTAGVRLRAKVCEWAASASRHCPPQLLNEWSGAEPCKLRRVLQLSAASAPTPTLPPPPAPPPAAAAAARAAAVIARFVF